MKYIIMLIFSFSILTSSSGQSEYFRTGESGYNFFGEYAQARDWRNRRLHAGGINWGFGWGGRGEIGLGLGILDKKTGGNLHVGYNLIPKVKEYGVKLEADFVKYAESKRTLVYGISLFGNLGNKNLIVPSVGAYKISDEYLLELKIRGAIGSANLKFAPFISIGILEEDKLYSLGLGIMGKVLKKELPSEN